MIETSLEYKNDHTPAILDHILSQPIAPTSSGRKHPRNLEHRPASVGVTALNMIQTVLNPGAKRLEIGLFKARNLLTVYLLSESFPVWLCSLDAAWCSELVLVGFSSVESFFFSMTRLTKQLVIKLLEPFVTRNILSFCSIQDFNPERVRNVATLSLFSGNIFTFLLPLIEQFQNCNLCGVVDSHFSGRLRRGKPTSNDTSITDRIEALCHPVWHRCRHSTTGGPTDYVALFVHTRTVIPPLSVLQRGIRHVFQASIRPGPPPKSFPVDRRGHFYTLDDRLIPGLYHLPVLCPSTFHASGTGYRALNLDELITAHGFPRTLVSSTFPRDVLDLPPCELLAANLDPLWDTSPYVDNEELLRPVKRSKELSTWIPSLDIFLPHTWVDETLVTATASKADDAALPCSLWDARLELIFPGCTPRLEFLRTLLMIKLRRRLFREIRQYLVSIFGVQWAATLQMHRKVLHLGSLAQHTRGEKENKKEKEDENKKEKEDEKDAFILINGNQCVEAIADTVADTIVTFNSKSKIENNIVSRVDIPIEMLNKRTLNGITSGEFQQALQKDSKRGKRTHPFRYMPAPKSAPECPISNIVNSNESDKVLTRLCLEAEKVSEVLTKICGSSWWEWDSGSALFFWRWGEELVLARDGMIPFITSELPTNVKKGRALSNNENIDKIISKLETILRKGYIQPGYVSSLIDFFAVPKGDDIRLVYNGTSCGLNEATWAPNFWLPYPRTAIRLLDYGFYSADADLGEMFLNFPLHESIQASSGIDLTPFQEKLDLGSGKKTSWFRWKRNWMGARLSPYSSVQFCSLAEEFCRGNHLDSDNPLRWDIIVLNLPGSKTFDPSKPRVYKWDRTMGAIAGDFIIFVDDCRVTAMTLELAWAIARQVCSRFQYLGIQDATRKRKPPTQTPGAWAGSVFATTDNTVTKTVTQDKWEKAQRIVKSLNDQVAQGGSKAQLGYKELEISRGFLCHLSMTYEVLVPFLKGFHLALSKHLGQRNDDGWKLTDKAWSSYLYGKSSVSEETVGHDDAPNAGGEDGEHQREVPKFVTVSEHLRKDLRALSIFLECKTPPIINDRSANVRIVRYGFGDASGTGFGSTIQTKLGLKYRVGVWGTDEEGESSNFKELENVVTTIEEEAAEGSFSNSALFFFTDNSTVEAALYKGNSSSQKLFDLVVRFRRIQLVYGMQVVVSHVSGKRMIHQGTDGVSRGNMKEGVGSGVDMLQFIPLHQGAIERHGPLLDWIKDWAGARVEYLSPIQWFTRGHDHLGGQRDKSGFWRIKSKPGVFLWAPPPAAAEAAIEQLRRALIKRQRSTHIIIVPRLLTTEWLKQLYKSADLLVSLPAGVDNKAWPSHMFEPLTLAFVFPFLSIKPWKRRGTPKMCDMARKLSITPGVHDDTEEGEQLQNVWGKRQAAASSFLEARTGDHLMVPFECDRCIFWKLRGEEPNPTEKPQDKLLLACIRRVNLDAFWSRMASTVTSNKDKVRSGLKLSESVGLQGPYLASEPFPEWDHCGYEVAIQMVLASLKPGRYSSEYTQWDTVRKMRTAASNHFRASGQANRVETSLCDDRGHTQRLSSDPCASVWFGRFFIGCKRRMGQDWRPNKAMSIHLILKLIRRIDGRMVGASDEKEREKWLTFGAYVVTSFVLSLRGVEGLLVDLEGMILNRHKGDARFFVIALLGKVKGEHHGRCHLLPSVKITSSGICVHSWVDMLVDEKIRRGFKKGPLFSDWSGKVQTTGALDKILAELLEEIFDDLPHLFPPSIGTREEIADCYQVYRSIRRSSDTRALEEKVFESDIDIVNRWQKIEKAQGNRPTLQMKYHYAQVELLLEPFLRYTFAM